jgi:hypothetical protein
MTCKAAAEQFRRSPQALKEEKMTVSG